MVLRDGTNHDGGVVYPPSEITAQTPIIQNDLRNNNIQGRSYLPPPPLPRFSCYHPPPVVPPFHSSSISESNSAWNDDTTINDFSLSSIPVLPPPHFSHHHPPPVVPPFKSSSVLEPINTSTSSSPQNEPDLLPRGFSLLIFIHIIPRRFSLLRFVQSNLPLLSSPPFIPQKMRRVIHRRQIAILHRPILPPLLITLITTTGITSQKFDLSIHHQV